ncbi:MAG: uracil-DNA glycosylase [Blautia massiliensis (ex Durand et al. 2017)]
MDLQTLQQECLACRRCGLCESRTHVVFGQGVPDAEVLFVGEGPGANEDAQGMPFVGRSGQLLDHYLEAVDLDREKNVYIANIVKCRPPQNRDPLPEEASACLPWLRQQFQLLHPKIVVCLGRIAAQQMIDPRFAISRVTAVFMTSAGRFLWLPITRPPCCATPPTNPLYLATLWPCGKRSPRSATIPIK